MPEEANPYFMLADGPNLASDLERITTISPPLFRDYYDLRTEWHSEVLLDLNGDQQEVPIGRPWMALLFHVLRRDEYQFLMHLNHAITIHALDKDADTWKNFNAQRMRPQGTWKFNEWRDVRMELRALVELIEDSP